MADGADLVVTTVRAYWTLKAARAQVAILQSAVKQLTTMADVVAHMQITSCHYDTGSCPEREWGDFHKPGYAKFRTHLDFIQLDPRNGPCNVTSTPDTEYTITDDVHHLLVDYTPPTVMISATCGGFSAG